MKSDSELVKAFLAGDRQAYGRLFERHERSVLAVTMSVLGNRDAAQDAAQDAFVKGYRKLDGLRRGAAFGSWIRRIARREAIQMGRRSRHRQNVERLATQASGASNDGSIDEANRRLLDAVMRLPKHERAVVMLHYFDDHPAKRISEITGQRVGTVTVRLSRARARLQKWLKESST
ncbi:MAG TPA: RNA polymerase sigma factor [Sedimentisphaerales bacterium]|nr:RNA polymerase sigma factor [Sedimentisphaerales bacterium]